MSVDLDALLEGYYESLSGSPMVEDYHERHGTESALILTVFDDEHAANIAEHLRERIEGKVVVELGAGIGLLACHLATVARRVYAIEVDPAWSSSFLAAIYAKKPRNLTFIFGLAEEAPPIAADVALFCTHSGHAALYRAASRFAPEIIDVYAEVLAEPTLQSEIISSSAPSYMASRGTIAVPLPPLAEREPTP